MLGPVHLVRCHVQGEAIRIAEVEPGDEVFDTTAIQIGPSDLAAIHGTMLGPVHLVRCHVQGDVTRRGEPGDEVLFAALQVGPSDRASAKVGPVHHAHLHEHLPVGRRGHLADCVDGV